ncbi:dihydroxyacetone kinase subunit DhaL [Nocardiopsis ganjiahuensis]|uniref:dihydroxyacetone kinase subunit DhaL n=1 Tax=Nocardiopsis ganjiahuensis TaxID=239984 RepID=UPI00034AE09E|nr:dihydroxyacetone kinase subunit DhaL [Nocardiopsis ganjiahuensis]
MPETELTGAETEAWLLAFADRVIKDVDELTELDRQAGDGDFGWNIGSALKRARANLEGENPAEVFQSVSDTFLASGGTSGPLFGLWFGRLGAGPSAPWTVSDLAKAFDTATGAVRRLGRAEVGHKTMVDAMVPATEALATTGTRSWREALREAARAARTGAESTSGMIAHRGRASYLGERAQSVLDPGAVSVAWFFESAEGA